MTSFENIVKSATAGLFFCIVGTLALDIYKRRGHHSFSIRERVEQGYVHPVKLHFEFQDLDGNGTNEFLLKYDGTRYLFKTNNLGEPFFQRYQLSPLERPKL